MNNRIKDDKKIPGNYLERFNNFINIKKENFLYFYGTPKDFFADIYGKVLYSIKENKGMLGEFAVGAGKVIAANELEKITGRTFISVYLYASGSADMIYAGAVRPNKTLPNNHEFTIVEKEAFNYIKVHLEDVIYKLNNHSN